MINKTNLKFTMIFLIGILMINFISAYTQSSFQYTSTGLSSSYLGTQGVTLYPQLNENQCGAGQDFLIQINPLGCSPSVIRSDLLEEQNVPVFCPLSATKLNPMIEVEAIDHISFSKRNYSSNYVQGIGFHPAKAAIRSTKTLLNSPILENIGYAVIVLKKQKNESSMPEYVEGDLTATIRYDIKNAFGIGNAELYVPTISDSEWNENFKQYGFWNGNGYLRADYISDEEAQISIYRDEEIRVSTLTLKKGETSQKVYMPEYYCLASLQLQFVDSEVPEERVKLAVDGNNIELIKGQKFLDNNCNIIDIKKQGCFQKVSIFCNTDDKSSTFELTKSPKIKISIDGDENEYSIGEKIFEDVSISSIDSNSNDFTCKNNFTVQILDSSNKKHTLKLNSEELISERKVVIKGFSDAFDYDLSDNDLSTSKFKENLDSSISEYRKVIDSFSQEKISEDAEGNFVNTYSEQALIESIEVAERTKQYSKRKDLAKELIERYPDSIYIDKIREIINEEYENSNTGISSKDVFIDGRLKTIYFSGIKVPNLDDYSADVTIETSQNPIVENLWKGKIVNLSGDYDETIELEKLTKDSSIFLTRTNTAKSGETPKYSLQRIQVYHNTKTGGTNILGDVDKSGNTVSFGDNGKYRIKVNNVNIKDYAKIKIIPGIENEKTEANFSFKIGIEKRAIQLSPEKTKEKIKEMNKTIEKWQKISDGMANAVKGFKAACLGTGAVLTVKNFFENSGGKSLARQSVMRSEGGWFEKCTSLVSEGRYPSVDSCLYEKSSEIEQDVKLRYRLMQDQNNKLKEIDSKYAEDTIGGKVVNDEKFIEEYMPTVKNSLSGIAEVKDPTSNSVPVKVSDLDSVLTSNGWKENYFSTEQARDIELNAKILKDSSSSETLKNIAQKDLYKSLSEIQSVSNSYAERASIANDFSVAPTDIAFLEVKKAKKLNYEGTQYYSIKNKISNSLPLEDNDPVQILQVSSGEKYIVVLDDSSGKETLPIKRENDKLMVYDLNGKLVEKPIDELNKVYFQKFDRTSYQNKYINSEASYYETDPYKGMPAIVPFDLNNGWYAATKQTLPIAGNIRAYDESGKVSSYYLCNIGKNGRQQFTSGIGDDICEMINLGINQPYNQFSGLTESEVVKLVKAATSAIEQASRQYKSGITKIKISTTFGSYTINVGKPATNVPETQCQDFMSPQDCYLLFNACDPVICPSSRCNLGGNYYVDDVVQSGIIGSTALCLPNAKEKIFVPVCLTGIQAGTDSLLSIYKASQKCLQESITTGKNMGICDEIQSIYLCEFFWKEAVPIANLAIPKVLESFTTQGTRGGGEYLGVSSAWENAENSMTYFTQYYGANSYKAFKARTTGEVGSAVCKNFISVTYPSNGDFFDNLVEPDSPSQYSAWFSEDSYTTSTVPPTSQYKVYYHIYAGKDIGAYYRVYLKNPTGSSFYQNTPILTVASGFIGRGEYEDQTKDFLAPSGYQELCITINSKEECGFKQVSTSFAVNYVKDQYLKEQASKTDVKTEAECISGTPSVYSLANPNLEEGVDDIINPNLYNRGITRICATDDPGKSTDYLSGTNNSRWKQVGYCDYPNKNIKCWLDSRSVVENVDIKSVENKVLKETSDEYMKVLQEEGGYLDESEFSDLVNKIKSENNANIKLNLIKDNFEKVFFSKQKAELLLLKGRAYGSLAIAEFEKIIDSSITKTTIPESVDVISNTTDADPVKKIYNIDTAIEKVNTLSGKYSEKAENKQFVDQIYLDEILNSDEYSEIIGEGLWKLEGDMKYVKTILLQKKARMQNDS